MNFLSIFAGIFVTVASWFGHGPVATSVVPTASSSAITAVATSGEVGTASDASSSGTSTLQSGHFSITPSVTLKASGVSDTTDPLAALAGLGGDIYADGILPLGDYHYVTSAPKKGYVYVCNVMSGGQGASVNGPWIGTSGGGSADTWNSDEKTAVEGSVSWPNAYVNITTSGTNTGAGSFAGGTRLITSNDLPTVGTTGIFPIAASDPAYQYDSNPNSVEAQSLSFSLPAEPTMLTNPQCIYGEVGIMTNGVLLLDGFDAEYRDAEAHEMQDSCAGHPHEGGIYHYHSLSPCIANATVTNIIGWAFDGFPITGPLISAGTATSPPRYLTTADLDECHGITSLVSEGGKMVSTYHYVMTEDFPYSVSCFRGKSYEPKPGGGSGGSGAGSSGSSSGSSTDGMSGMGGMNMQTTNQSGQNGTPPTPPAAAISACANVPTGGMCSFTTPNGTISGTCQTPPGQSSLACVPQ